MKKIPLYTLTASLLATPLSFGALMFDQDVTNNVIFGMGNDNGSFTTDTSANGAVELGLRAKLRFDSNDDPQNIFNSNGDGSYTFSAGLPPMGGFSFASNSSSTALWNFEWSVNSDANGGGGVLSDLTYLISIDFDPGAGATNFFSFDPINLPSADHAVGTNATGPGAGTSDSANYGTLIDNNNLAQNSWNMEFFNGPGFPFDGRNNGEYTIALEAFDGTSSLARTEITVNAVPEPSSSLALAGLLAGSLFGRRRR